MAPPAEIQIGELARHSGWHVETIRYYERIKLLPSPTRSAGHYRLYALDDVRRLGFIRRARELGFTLKEVRALLALSTRPTRASVPIRTSIPLPASARPAVMHGPKVTRPSPLFGISLNSPARRISAASRRCPR
jgi:DNA-binding transcriptional MerR regulator